MYDITELEIYIVVKNDKEIPSNSFGRPMIYSTIGPARTQVTKLNKSSYAALYKTNNNDDLYKVKKVKNIELEEVK